MRRKTAIPRQLPKTVDYLDQLQNSMHEIHDIIEMRRTYHEYAQKISVKELEKRVKILTDSWRPMENQGIECSSGYGISAVAFLPKMSGLRRSIQNLMDALARTQAAKKGKVILIDSSFLHMTVYQLKTGKLSLYDITNDDQMNIKSIVKKAVERTRDQILKSGEEHPMRIIYAKEVAISRKGRIHLNGYPEGTGLSYLRNEIAVGLRAQNMETKAPKGEHINLASIVKVLTTEELDEIYEAIEKWKEGGHIAGWLETDACYLVKHSNDHLNRRWTKDKDEKFMVKRPLHQRNASKFVNLIGLTEDELYSALQDARNKYNPISHKALPFEGYSVIRNISAEEAKKVKLSDIAIEFKELLHAAGLGHVVAFVDFESFHLTTFDLINEVEYRQELEKNGTKICKEAYAQVEKKVLDASHEYLRNNPPPKPIFRKIKGIGMYAPNVITFTFEKDEDGSKEFKKYRRELHLFIAKKVGKEYTDYRPLSWSKGLSPHLTIGYIVNPMSEDEIGKFLGVVSDYNTSFREIEFELSMGEVTRFTDMDHYESIKERKIALLIDFKGSNYKKIIKEHVETMILPLNGFHILLIRLWPSWNKPLSDQRAKEAEARKYIEQWKKEKKLNFEVRISCDVEGLPQGPCHIWWKNIVDAFYDPCVDRIIYLAYDITFLEPKVTPYKTDIRIQNFINEAKRADLTLGTYECFTKVSDADNNNFLVENDLAGKEKRKDIPKNYLEDFTILELQRQFPNMMLWYKRQRGDQKHGPKPRTGFFGLSRSLYQQFISDRRIMKPWAGTVQLLICAAMRIPSFTIGEYYIGELEEPPSSWNSYGVAHQRLRIQFVIADEAEYWIRNSP